jgi:hypothetical protein
MLKTYLERLTWIRNAVGVLMLFTAAALFESIENNGFLILVLKQRWNIDATLFAYANILGAFFIFTRYLIQGKQLDSLGRKFEWLIAISPLTFFLITSGVYLLITSSTKTTGLFLLGMWGFCTFVPVIRSRE